MLDRTFLPRAARVSVHAGILLVLIGALSWLSGAPMIFPSLGPSAFELAADPGHPYNDARNVIGAHLIGIVVGLAAYHVIAPGVPFLAERAPLSMPGMLIAASATASVVLTAAGMLATGLIHAPATATTLVVGLGLLARPLEGVIILLAVVALVTADYVLKRDLPAYLSLPSVTWLGVSRGWHGSRHPLEVVLSTPKSNKFIDAVHRVENEGELDPIMSLFADDADLSTPIDPTPEHGAASVRKFWRAYRRTFDEIHSEIGTIVETDDTAVLEWTSEGTIDGRAVRYEGVSMLGFDGDAIEHFRVYFDSAELRRQIGGGE